MGISRMGFFRHDTRRVILCVRKQLRVGDVCRDRSDVEGGKAEKGGGGLT